MKTIHYVPPVIALAIAAAWLTSQNRSLTRLEQESAKLREDIDTARLPTVAANQQVKTHQKQDTPHDWKRIAVNLKSPGKKELLKKLASEMSDTELCKALDEIASLHLSVTSSRKIMGILNDALAEENPELALNRFMEESGGPADTAFENFLKLDSVAAIAWLDRHIAAGFFPETIEGLNMMRAEFEKRVIMPLVKSNPSEAARRLNQMGELSKLALIDDAFDELGLGDKVAFANFFRSTVPGGDRKHRMQYYINDKIKDGDFGKVKDYLDHFDATPQERIKILESITSRKMSDEQLRQELLAEPR